VARLTPYLSASDSVSSRWHCALYKLNLLTYLLTLLHIHLAPFRLITWISGLLMIFFVYFLVLFSLFSPFLVSVFHLRLFVIWYADRVIAYCGSISCCYGYRNQHWNRGFLAILNGIKAADLGSLLMVLFLLVLINLAALVSWLCSER